MGDSCRGRSNYLLTNPYLSQTYMLPFNPENPLTFFKLFFDTMFNVFKFCDVDDFAHPVNLE